jgi:hypothetical protein
MAEHDVAMRRPRSARYEPVSGLPASLPGDLVQSPETRGHPWIGHYTGRQMGSWYWIGVAAGLGVAIGVALAGFLAGTRAGLTAALVLAAGAGVLVGLALGQWGEAAGGGAGGVLGAIGAARLVTGTLRRGGARFGTAVFMTFAAVGLAVLAWIPIFGYIEAVVVPALAARLQGRAADRYAGLRSLAKD